MFGLLSVVAVAIGAAAAFAPILIGLIPRLGPGVLYRLRLWRAMLAAGALATALAAYARRPSRAGGAGMVITALLAGLSQRLDPKRFFIALDRPPHRAAALAELGDEAIVLGAEVDSAACAWALDMVAPHHLVNDRVGETPVLVAY